MGIRAWLVSLVRRRTDAHAGGHSGAPTDLELREAEWVEREREQRRFEGDARWLRTMRAVDEVLRERERIHDSE